MDLTYKQRLFVGYYLGEAKGNGSEAARLAGYKEAKVTASRLLTKANIQAAIGRKLASVAMCSDEVLARLSEMASADIGTFLQIHDTGDFSINLLRARKARRTRVIKKVKVSRKTYSDREGEPVEEIKTELELHNPQFALDKLAQYHGIYETKAKTPDGAAHKPRIAIPGSPASPGGPKVQGGPRKRKPAS